MAVLKRAPRCGCGWTGDQIEVDLGDYIDRNSAHWELNLEVRNALNRHLYFDCPDWDGRWEEKPTYKCDSCRQMVELRNDSIPAHLDKRGEQCAGKGNLPRIQIVNGGAQGTGKRR